MSNVVLAPWLKTSLAEDRFSRLIDAALDGIVVINRYGLIVEWNHGEEQITGIPGSEAIGHPLWEIQLRLAPQEARNHNLAEILKSKMFAGLKEGRKLKRIVEDKIQRADGTIRFIQSIIFSLESDGEMFAAAICRDVTHAKHLESELRQSNNLMKEKAQTAAKELKEKADQLQKMAFELTRVQDNERKRLSDILHDDLQQDLAAARFQLSALRNSLADTDLKTLVSRTESLLTCAMEKSRTLSQELSPPALTFEDIHRSFEWLAARMKTQHGLSVDLRFHEPIDLHSELLRIFIFRAAQEMLFNVVKHARVCCARLRLGRRRNWLYLLVSDRGPGFHPDSLDSSLGRGLSGIRDRVRLLNGRFIVKSKHSHGTRFLVAIPSAIDVK